MNIIMKTRFHEAEAHSPQFPNHMAGDTLFMYLKALAEVVIDVLVERYAPKISQSISYLRT